MFSIVFWPDLAETQLATAETISRRLPILWWAAMWPSPSAHAETRKMVVEKQVAFAEGLIAMQIELMTMAFRPWWSPRLAQEALQDLVYAASAPAVRRVRANARRLRRD